MTATRNPVVERVIKTYLTHILSAIEASRKGNYHLSREILDRTRDSISRTPQSLDPEDSRYQAQFASLQDVILPLKKLTDSLEQMREEQI